MKKKQNAQSKLSRFYTETAKKLSRLPFFKNSFLKPVLTAAALTGVPTPMNVNTTQVMIPADIPGTVFKPSLSDNAAVSFPGDNIVKAFKHGRARTISEFLELYDPLFKYDTIVINADNIKSRLCHGQYIRHKDIVEIKHFVADTANATPQQAERIRKYCSALNSDRYQIPVKAHECSHKSFHNEGKIKIFDCVMRPNPFYFEPVKIPYRLPELKTKVYRLGLRDAAVINQWNEIGGDLGYLIAERELYLQTKDPKVFTYKTAYTEAVKNGTINPLDFSPYARKKEYAFLINSTIEWWLETKKDGYAYTSKSDVETMINGAKKQNIMLATESLKDIAYKKFSACLTLPIDGRLVNFFDLVEEKNKHLTPQPMVEKIIAKAEKEMPMYAYHNKPFPLHNLWQKRMNKIMGIPDTLVFGLSAPADKTIPAQSASAPSGNGGNALWIMNKSLCR